jgi:hypothetical protein
MSNPEDIDDSSLGAFRNSENLLLTRHASARLSINSSQKKSLELRQSILSLLDRSKGAFSAVEDVLVRRLGLKEAA